MSIHDHYDTAGTFLEFSEPRKRDVCILDTKVSEYRGWAMSPDFKGGSKTVGVNHYTFRCLESGETRVSCKRYGRTKDAYPENIVTWADLESFINLWCPPKP